MYSEIAEDFEEKKGYKCQQDKQNRIFYRARGLLIDTDGKQQIDAERTRGKIGIWEVRFFPLLRKGSRQFKDLPVGIKSVFIDVSRFG